MILRKRPDQEHVILAMAAVALVCILMTSARADDRPPVAESRWENYVRTGTPQAPISHSTTTGGTPDIVQRGSTTICFPARVQIVVGPCDNETHFLFSESQALTSVGTGATWGESLADPENTGSGCSSSELCGPASGNVPNGFTVGASGWKTVMVPTQLNSSEVGYRGGYCDSGTGIGWPCDDDADCPGSGTCGTPNSRGAGKNCMFMHSEAAASSVCHIEVYR